MTWEHIRGRWQSNPSGYMIRRSCVRDVNGHNVERFHLMNPNGLTNGYFTLDQAQKAAESFSMQKASK